MTWLISKPSKKQFITYAALVVFGTLLLFYAVVIEPGQLVVQRQAIKLPHWSPALNHLKVAVLTDLHVGCLSVPVSKLRRVIAVTNDQEPDLIVMLGDFVASHGRSSALKPEAFAHELSALKAKYGVYAVLGNHDWWYNGEEVRKELQRADIHVLENESVQLKINDVSLWIAGLADQWTRTPNIPLALKGVPIGSPCLVLMHEPDLLRAVPESVSLSLAGHTHGGQVSFPIIGAPIVPTDLGSKFARGLIVEGVKHYFVSSGVGTSVLPVRFGVPPEVCILDLTCR